MKQIPLKIEPVTADHTLKLLEDHCISVNRYAVEFFTHPQFSGHSEEITVVIASLQELGFQNGATLYEIFEKLPDLKLKPCPQSTGLFLRLAWTDQPTSNNSVLSGTHDSPDMAVMVLSIIPEKSDEFPKGLYLRNVDGKLWLRGYKCDTSYRFPCDALFAFKL